MIQQIDYPLELRDIVVIGRLSARARTLSVRPKLSGEYTLFLWPQYFPEKQWIVRHDLAFANQSSPPARMVFDLDEQQRLRSFASWEWALMQRASTEEFLPASEALFTERAVAKGTLQFEESIGSEEVRTVVWSCHQPFKAQDGELQLDPHTEPIMQWYGALMDQFVPHAIWGFGDNAYADGTKASNVPDQVYNDEGWQDYDDNVQQLRYAYSRMYRYHWSFTEFRQVLATYPHLMMWDDHEIRDGWGSEDADWSVGNLAMFSVAKEVAEQYVLNVGGPRIRPEGEAHKAYIDGVQAVFLTDTRTTRHYVDPGGQLFSEEQLEDLYRFNEIVAADHNVRYYLLGTTVPFLYVSDSFESVGSQVPKFLTDMMAGVRDDLRDSWSSPGNKEALKKVLSALRHLQLRRPDLHIVNISGDIHVANAFELLPPGFLRPIYQITTSALSNRSHMPDLVAQLIGIGDFAFSPELGLIRRLWQDITDPNVLCITATAERLALNLKILPVDDSKNTDQQVILS